MAANKGQKKILAILTALAGLLVALACFPQSVFEPDRPAQLKMTNSSSRLFSILKSGEMSRCR